MNFKKQSENKFSHFICRHSGTGGKTLLIGVSKSMEPEEAVLLLDNPLVLYPDGFLSKYFLLSTDNRQIVGSALEKLGGTQGKGTGFCPAYWEAVLDFIFVRYGTTLYDIAFDMAQYFPSYETGKQIYDRLDRVKNCKKPRPETWDTIRELLAYYLLTDDIVTTGRGKIYSLAQTDDEETVMHLTRNYTPKEIRRLWKEDNKKELKDIILELTGVSENILVETPVQIAFLREGMNPDITECLEKTIEELHKRQ